MASFRDHLGAFYLPLRFGNRVVRCIRRASSARLRVLSYHDMSQGSEALFERQLRWLMRSWKIVTPEKFAAMIDGSEPIVEDSLLLTFDDGTISNLHVAGRVLEPLGIQALFFVVAQYVMMEEGWRDFASERITLTDDPSQLPENFHNMSLDDLKMLVSMGHTIGSHTASHARLSELSGIALKNEIIDGGDLLEQALEEPVHHFAYPFGNFESISAEASQIARKRFKYVYSGMRGDNGVRPLSWHLLRDSNDPSDSLWYTGACLEGGADFLYADKLNVCRSWID